jgi:exonuclease SbcC
MQPLELTLQAFGPFADCQRVDFTQLGSAPLFLINGATGAGKSTLLDALCFALYGQTSGKERDASQMRCDHSPAELLTEVTFTFKLGEAIYKIERQPQQERPKARGEGTTTQSTEANLWKITTQPHKLLISKSAVQVNQYIEQLTGLDANQFRQVMVLPQGKFREFLLADSNDREKLFETLFQTSIYSRIQNALKERASHLEKLRHDVKIQESLVLESLHNAPNQPLADLTAQYQKDLTEAETHFEQLKIKRDAALQQQTQATQLMAEFTALEKNQQTLHALHSQTSAMDHARLQLQRAQQAERINALYTVLNVIHKKQTAANIERQQHINNITQCENNIAQLQQEQLQAQASFNACLHFPENISQLKVLLPKVDELHLLQQHYLLTEKNEATALQTLQHQQIERDNTQRQRDTAQQALEKLKREAEQLPVLRQQREQCEIIGKQLGQYEKLAKIVAEVTASLDAHQRQLAEVDGQYQQQKTQVLQLELTWHNQQAAYLASQLQQDQPCPVCGSSEHPAPAINYQHTLIEKSAVDAARQSLDNIQQHLNALINTKTQLQADCTHSEKNLVDARQALAENPLFLQDGLKTIEDYRADYKVIDADIRRVEKNQQAIIDLDAQIQQFTHFLAEHDHRFSNSQQQYQQSVTALALAKQSVVALENSLALEWRKPQALAEYIAQLQQQFTQAETALKTAEQNLLQQQTVLNKAQASKDQFLHFLAGLNAEQADASQQWQEALEKSSFVDQGDFLSAQLSFEAQADLTQKIDNYQQAQSRLSILIEQQSELLNSQQKPDLQKLADDYLAVDANFHAAQQQWQQDKHQLDNLLKAEKKLKAIAKQLEAIDRDFALYGTLAEAANGKNPRKLSLQRFVLGVLLDDVLIEASERLLKMSKGRYRLLRNQDRAKGNRASGLELMVEDNHTGKTRNANTLSGGESFIAALALALGLSDVVQAYAGGIQLDALFIDEGFGSLDQEALDLALQTLVDLQSSGRMIGIISHVSELKEQIAVRIDVLHGRNGNKIVVRNGI